MQSLKVRGIHYRGRIFDLVYDHKQMSVQLKTGGALQAVDSTGVVHHLVKGSTTVLPLGGSSIRSVGD